MRISATEQGLIELGRASATDIHLLVDFEHDLDASALELAWGAVVERYPVLSMRVVNGEWVPDDLRPGFDGRALLDRDGVPEIQNRAVLRTGPIGGERRLAVSVDHVAVDGRGLLQLVDELRRGYTTALGGGMPEREVDPTLRSLDVALHESIAPADRLRLVAQGTARWGRLLRSTHIDPAPVAPTTPRRRFATAGVEDAFAAIRRIREETAFSTDGILIGLLTVAWTRLFGQGPGGGSGWLLATDLRPYLGIDGGIGNLSGTEPVLVPGDAIASPRETVSAASEAVASVREGWPGAGPELLAGMYRWVPASVTGQAARWSFDAVAGRGFTRVLTNLGAAPPDLHRWPEGEALRISFVPPLASPPYVALLLLTAGGATRLSARVGDDWFTRSHLEALAGHLNKLATEI